MAGRQGQQQIDLAIRAKALAEVAGGSSIVSVGKKYRISRETIENWMVTDGIKKGELRPAIQKTVGQLLIEELAKIQVDIPMTAQRIKDMLNATRPDPCGPGTVADNKSILAALDMLIKILGAYAPTRQEVDVRVEVRALFGKVLAVVQDFVPVAKRNECIDRMKGVVNES